MFWKKQKEKKFLSDNELFFYNEMHSFLSKNYHTKFQLHTQVRLADFCVIKRSLIKHYWSVDFLICDLEDGMKPIVAIELNWKEHYKWSWRKDSDNRKKELLKMNNIPLVTIKNEELNNLAPRIYEIDNILKGWSLEDLKQSTPDKLNIIEQQKIKHENAYNKWSEDDDRQLIKLYNEWKSIKELMWIFNRNYWWINMRLKKLWVKK